MRKFLKKIGIVLVTIIVFAYPLDYFASTILKRSTYFEGEFQVWNDIFNGEIISDIAIYGSSRAWVHISPQILKDSLGMNVYNFGIDGHNFWLQYLRHIEYFKYNKHPKIIIHSVDVFTFQKKEELYNLDQFIPYMLNNNDIYKWTKDYIGFTKNDYFIPLLRYQNKGVVIYNALKNNIEYPIYRTNGYRGRDDDWNKDFEKAINSNNTYNAKIDTKTIELYSRFLIECKKNNIQVILVYTPEYIDGQKYVQNRVQIMNLIRNIAKNNNLSFFDYSNDELCFDKEFFCNAQHLNRKGAELFSRKFSHDLMKSEVLSMFNLLN